MVGAETERFDQAFAELRAKAKRYSILAGVFFIVAVVLAVIRETFPFPGHWQRVS